MAYRVLSFAAAGATLLACAAAVWLYFRPPAPEGPGLAVEDPERVLDRLVVGREADVDFRVVNRTGRTLQIVGAEDSCGVHCCFRVKQELPLDVPPQGSVTVSVAVTALSLGSFRDQLRIFLDDGSLREVALVVRGEAVAAESASTKKGSSRPPTDASLERPWDGLTMPAFSRDRRFGFTLIELLVVIAIISVLIGLLLAGGAAGA